MKVRLRDWGFNGEGDGGANNTLALTHDRSFNQTNMSRIGSQHCRMTESVNGRNRGTVGKFLPSNFDHSNDSGYHYILLYRIWSEPE